MAEALSKTYKKVIEVNGGVLEPDQELEYCYLIYNLVLLTLERKQLGVCEKLLEKLEALFKPSNKNSNPATNSNDASFAAEHVVPLSTTVSLLNKNYSKALNIIQDLEASKSKQDMEESLQQRFFLSHALALVQSKNHKAFKKDLKLTTDLSPKNQVTYEFLRANMEFVKGNVKKAAKLLSMGVAQVGGNGNQANFDGSYVNTINAFFQNNHGCNYLLSKKPNLGVLFCHNAFNLHKETLSKLSPATPKLLLKVKTNEMIYNTGVCLLHTRSPKMALETFCNAAEAFETSPNFWLRLAECCISHLRKDDEVANEIYGKPSWLAAEPKNGKKDMTYQSLQFKTKTAEILGKNQVTPALTEDFAIFCLECAEKLLEHHGSLSSNSLPDSPTGSKSSSSNPSSGTSSPSKTSTMMQNRSHLVLSSIWTNAAYLHLCRGHFSDAIAYAVKVLEDSQTRSGYKFLANLYKAEAHLGLGQHDEALVILSDITFSELSFSTESSNSSSQQPQLAPAPTETSGATFGKAMMKMNFAVAHILGGKTDRAEELLESHRDVIPTELLPKWLSLRLYLALKKGNVEKAIHLASKHSDISFVRSSFF